MPVTQTSFLEFVFKQRLNQILIIATLFGSVVVWFVFKSFYPHPNIIYDSYYYIWAAYYNEIVSAWPIGYSKFLQVIRIFTHSANSLLLLQYILLQLSFLFFFFSLRYLYKPGRTVTIILYVFLFLNPIYIFTSNLVLSDTLFLGLSLIWVVNLLWIIYKPQYWMFISQAVILLITFSIRHSALYYPLIGGLAILLSSVKVQWKIGAIFLQCLFIGGFIIFTTYKNNEYYGVKQFSPFQGWKLASNALYIYEHVPASQMKPVPEKFRDLDKKVKDYYSSKHEQVSLFHPDPSWGSYYMFMYPSPLLTYKDALYGADEKFLFNVPVFSKMGPLYDEYGSYIIRHYPVTFAKYFVIPNIWIYLVPYPEVYCDDFNPFNLQQDTIGKIAQKWFDLKTLSVSKVYVAARSAVFNYYPMFNSFVHIVFIFAAIIFVLFRKQLQINSSVGRGIWLILSLWVVNFFFIVIASASLLRYQLFITVIEFSFAMVFVQLFLQKTTDGIEQN